MKNNCRPTCETANPPPDENKSGQAVTSKGEVESAVINLCNRAVVFNRFAEFCAVKGIKIVQVFALLINQLDEDEKNALIKIINSMLTKKRMKDLLDGEAKF